MLYDKTCLNKLLEFRNVGLPSHTRLFLQDFYQVCFHSESEIRNKNTLGMLHVREAIEGRGSRHLARCFIITCVLRLACA